MLGSVLDGERQLRRSPYHKLLQSPLSRILPSRAVSHPCYTRWQGCYVLRGVALKGNSPENWMDNSWATHSHFLSACSAGPQCTQQGGQACGFNRRHRPALYWSKAVNMTPRWSLPRVLPLSALSSEKSCGAGHASKMAAVGLGHLYCLTMPQFPHQFN